MAYPPSSYGDRPPLQGFRRSFTAPHRSLSLHEKAGLNNSDADAGILYTHPYVRIISFAPPPESINSKSGETNNDADYPIDTVETLPWRSRTENLMTSGALVIEKVRGSVPCFKCGPNFVQPIVRNSQCWCVDGESKFVLRKGKLQYYRFEFPTTSEAEKQKVEELKLVLEKVLKYERTPCPFKRAFHVELPDDAITPRRKGKWKRREDSSPSTPDANTPPLRRSKLARSWSVQVASATPHRESPAERRGSDYGFVQTPRHSSLRTSYLADRPETPSSMASSEELEQRNREEEESDNESNAELEDHGDHIIPEETFADSAIERETMADPMKVPGVGEHDLAAHVEQRPENALCPTQPPSSPPLESQPYVKEELLPETVEEELLSEIVGEELLPETVEDEPGAESGFFAEQELPSDVLAEGLFERVEDSETAEATTELDLLNVAEIPEGTFLPSTPELHYLEEHADLLEEHGFSDEELEPLAAAAGPINASSHYQHPDTETLPSVDIQDDTESIASTAESFHTIDSSQPEVEQKTVYDVDATPMAEAHDPLGLRNRQHKRDISEITVTASTFAGSPEMPNMERFAASEDTNQRPATPRLIQSSASDESWPDPNTPSDIQEGLRRRIKSHRSLSPLPPSRNVFTGGIQNQGNHLTSAILQKACNVALVKPIEVVLLLVHVLARIAGGATVNDLMSGELFKRPHQRRHSTSFPNQVARQQNDEDEDDFGMPLRGRTKSFDKNAKPGAQDTDADSIFDLD